VFLANQVEQVPGAIRENDAMNFRVILDGLQESIEHVFGIELGERREVRSASTASFRCTASRTLSPQLPLPRSAGLMR